MRRVILCLFLINMVYNTYSLLDDKGYSEEELALQTPWHRGLGLYGDLIDRAKPLKTTKNEDKFFYQSGYGLVGGPYYPIQYTQEYYRYPLFGELVYPPNGWYTSAIAASTNYLVRKDKNNL